MPPSDGPADQSAAAGLPNGLTATSQEPPLTNGHAPAVQPAASSSLQGEPPPLDQSWRTSTANKPMGKIMQRMANQCLKDLRDTVRSMAESPIQASTMPNALDKNPNSVSKKLQLINFAANQRDRFIKMLVLSDWARRGDEMARLVDLKVWQEKEISDQQNAIHHIGVTKRDMFAAKMPNPNIEGALEILSTGRESKQPHLGYMPPKRLTARQLLRTMQDMNVILMTRLNLHEDLPSHFNDYSVADGRATFCVAGEFEVDLSLADEDLASPFYFIDMRFLFTPRAKALSEGLRASLEARTNHALATQGLKGCYDFLHNFVLTHKLNTLRQQALDLIRDKWFGCLRVEDWRRVHRVLVVQYWTGLPGKKSWIELGISTGKQKRKRGQTPTSEISLRWFRAKGDEVVDEHIDINLIDLDFEKILHTVMAKHVSHSLGMILEGLNSAAGTSSKLDPHLQTSSVTPEECFLELSMPGCAAGLKVQREMVTGHINIIPPSPNAARAQQRLNSEPSREPAPIAQALASVLASDVRDRIGRMARTVGWRHIPLPRHDPKTTANLFGPGVLSFQVYRPHDGWEMPTALAVTLSLAGEKWWVVRLGSKTDPAGRLLGHVCTSARRIHDAENISDSSPISRKMLVNVEKKAMSEVSYAIVARELDSRNIPHVFRKIEMLTDESSITSNDSDRREELTSASSTMAIFIRDPSLVFAPESRSESARAAWTNVGPLRLTEDDLELDSGEGGAGGMMGFEARVSLSRDQFKNLQSHLIRKTRHLLASLPGDMRQIYNSLRSVEHVPFTQVAEFQKHLQHRGGFSTDSEITIRANEALSPSSSPSEGARLSLRLRAPFGQSIVPHLQARMQSLERMDYYLGVLHKEKMQCTKMSLREVQFIYDSSSAASEEPVGAGISIAPLKAILSFDEDGAMPVKLRLEPYGTNPHQRICALLEKSMNVSGLRNVRALVRILRISQPLFQTAEDLESDLGSPHSQTPIEEKTTHMAHGSVKLTMHVRSLSDYLLVFAHSQLKLRWQFAVRLRHRRVFPGAGTLVPLWQITRLPDKDVESSSDVKTSPTRTTAASEAVSHRVDESLKEQFFARPGSDWYGATTCIVATPEAAGRALRTLHSIINTAAAGDGVQVKGNEEVSEDQPGGITEQKAESSKTSDAPNALATKTVEARSQVGGQAPMAQMTGSKTDAFGTTQNGNGASQLQEQQQQQHQQRLAQQQKQHMAQAQAMQRQASRGPQNAQAPPQEQPGQQARNTTTTADQARFQQMQRMQMQARQRQAQQQQQQAQGGNQQQRQLNGGINGAARTKQEIIELDD